MRLKRIGPVFLLLVLLVVGGGCIQQAPESQPTPTPIPTPVIPTQQVRRGDIAEVLQVLGRVVPARQEDLYFRVGGRLQRVHVQAEDFVEENQLLAELDMGDLTDRLARARVTSELARLRLTDLRNQAQEGVQDLGYTLRRAQLNLDIAELRLVEAQGEEGDTDQDGTEAVRRAEINLAIARLSLQEAKDRERLAAGGQEEDLRLAKAQLDKAEVELQRAQAAYDAVSWRPDIGRLPQGQALQLATINYELALASYEKLTRGPPPDYGVQTLEKQVELAELDLERAREGSSDGDHNIELLQKNVELAKLELEQLSAQREGSDLKVVEQEKQVELAELEVERLEKTQSDMQIVAPFAGQILRMFPEVGEMLEGFESVMVLADPTSLEIGVQARGDAIVSIQVDQEVAIILNDYPTHTLMGRVTQLPSFFSTSTVAGQSQERLVRIAFQEVPTEVELEIGMLARLTIVVREEDDALIIPRTALQSRRDTFWVEVMEGGIVRRVPVETGIITDTEAQILTGLEEGQVIVVR